MLQDVYRRYFGKRIGHACGACQHVWRRRKKNDKIVDLSTIYERFYLNIIGDISTILSKYHQTHALINFALNFALNFVGKNGFEYNNLAIFELKLHWVP